MSTAGILAAEATPHATMKPAILTAALFAACCLASLIGRAVAEIPRDAVAYDRCEAVETNWVYNEQGDLVFVQLIFREEDRIIAWRMARRRRNPRSRVPDDLRDAHAVGPGDGGTPVLAA
jgi:hypothetical protein